MQNSGGTAYYLRPDYFRALFSGVFMISLEVKRIK